MWGLVLSALTIAVSFITEQKGEPKNSRSTNKTALMTADHRHFLSGALLGMGLSLLCSTIANDFKLWERGKVLWQSMWYWESTADAPLRIPKPLAAFMANYLQKDSNGDIRQLVGPKYAGTSRLDVSVLTVLPGRELPSRTTAAVEFYYVVSGTGLFSQQGVMDTSNIARGDCFVIDPGRMRWISNPSTNLEDLVLLRATDGAPVYSRSTFDTIRRDPNRKSTTLEVLADGLHQVKEYVSRASSV